MSRLNSACVELAQFAHGIEFSYIFKPRGAELPITAVRHWPAKLAEYKVAHSRICIEIIFKFSNFYHHAVRKSPDTKAIELIQLSISSLTLSQWRITVKNNIPYRKINPRMLQTVPTYTFYEPYILTHLREIRVIIINQLLCNSLLVFIASG